MKLVAGGVILGGTSLQYKTGAWRDQKPVLNLEKCKSCGICADVCPDSSIHVVGDVYIIDYDYCKGCALCEHECPVDAIEMVSEDK